MNTSNFLRKFLQVAFLFLLFSLVACMAKLEQQGVLYRANISIHDSLQNDPYVSKYIAPFKKQIDTSLEEVIAVASGDLESKGLSSPLGNLLADITFEAANAYSKKEGLPAVDFALLNEGGMRVDIYKGEVKTKHVFELMPFENTLVLVTLSGIQINSFVEYMVNSHKGHPISGVNLRYENRQVKEVIIDGNPIDPNRNYVIATNNYLYNGGDNMHFFKPNQNIVETPIKIRDIFIEGFRRYGTLPIILEQRLIIE